MKWIMFVNASLVKRGCFFISCIFNEMDYVVNASCVICKCFLKKKEYALLNLPGWMEWVIIVNASRLSTN